MSDNFNLQPFNKSIHKFVIISKISTLLKNSLLIFYIIIVIPFLIIEVLFFLSKNYKKIFNNFLIFPFYNWSFGHQIVAYDYCSRVYFPNKISLIHIIHKRNNPYLHQCFDNFEYMQFKSIFALNSQNLICKTNQKIITFFFANCNFIYP